MATTKFSGGCHCGNITLEMEITGEPDSYLPRACDCDFCRKHGASYLSNPKGKLKVLVNDGSKANRYRQGSGIAVFLICKECGVLATVSYNRQGQLLGAVNSKAVDGNNVFGEPVVISPKHLTDEEKIQRWEKIWFSDIELKYV